MKDWNGKRYWIVGGSEGLGLSIARRLSAAGVRLVLSARDEERLAEAAASLPGQVEIVPLDVSDRDRVIQAGRSIGDIDGLVWSAGVYWPQGARSWVPEQVEAMCDINFTGLVRVLGQVVPGMVERDAGHIVIVGSLSGYRGMPNSIGYGSSKAAVMHMAESLNADLHGTGIEVQLVNPGFIRTRLTDKNDFRMPFLMEPETAGREIWEHMNTDAFRRDFPRTMSALVRAGSVLPDWLYARVFG